MLTFLCLSSHVYCSKSRKTPSEPVWINQVGHGCQKILLSNKTDKQKKKVKDNSSHFQKAQEFCGRSNYNTCGFVFCLTVCLVESFKYVKITLTSELLIERKHHFTHISEVYWMWGEFWKECALY